MQRILKKGVLVDQTSTLHRQLVSILVVDGRIRKVSDQDLTKDYPQAEVIDLQGQCISAGWIDVHVHCFQGAWNAAVNPDRIGVESGVTMLIDAGSSGADTVEAFLHELSQQKTKVRAFLNISKVGLTTLHELRNIDDIDVKKAVAAVRQYPDFIVGLKLRASASVMGEDMQTPFTRAKEIQKEVHKPLMVHVGNYPPSLDEILDSLEAGDIVTHCFNGKSNGLFVDGKIRTSAKQARQRGVLFDVGHGSASFDYTVAEQAKVHGFAPDMAGSDLYSKNLHGPVYSLAHVMSKMIELGYDVDEVIAWNTCCAADALQLKDYGRVEAGKCADFTVFREVEHTSEILDSEGHRITLHRQVVPSFVMIDGEWMEVTYGNEEHL